MVLLSVVHSLQLQRRIFRFLQPTSLDGIMTATLRRSANIFKTACVYLLSRAANHQGRSAVNFFQLRLAVTAVNQDTILTPTVVVVLSLVILLFGMAEVSVDLFCRENHNPCANQHSKFLPFKNLMKLRWDSWGGLNGDFSDHKCNELNPSLRLGNGHRLLWLRTVIALSCGALPNIHLLWYTYCKTSSFYTPYTHLHGRDDINYSSWTTGEPFKRICWSWSISW
jgi:hypothetical protein